MGTGVTTLFSYGLCGAVVALTIVVGIGLYLWGKHREKRRKQNRPPS